MFIAVIIETFAEIRVQFQQTWGARLKETQEEHVQIFEQTDEGLKLVKIDENKPQGLAPKIFLRCLRSPWFNMSMLVLVLVNALITASIRHTHREMVDKRTLKFYKNIEVFKSFFSN